MQNTTKSIDTLEEAISRKKIIALLSSYYLEHKIYHEINPMAVSMFDSL